MTFSDSDWTRDPPLLPRVQAQRRAWMLAALIALGGFAVAMAWFGVEQILDARARGEALRHIGTVPPATAAGASAAEPAAPIAGVVATPPATSASAATAAPPPSAAAEPPPLAALEAEMKQRAKEAAQQAAAEAARRKERAWERWYQRPSFCNENPTSAQMVECANQHIRARKEFEERYSAGRL